MVLPIKYTDDVIKSGVYTAQDFLDDTLYTHDLIPSDDGIFKNSPFGFQEVKLTE